MSKTNSKKKGLYALHVLFKHLQQFELNNCSVLFFVFFLSYFHPEANVLLIVFHLYGLVVLPVTSRPAAHLRMRDGDSPSTNDPNNLVSYQNVKGCPEPLTNVSFTLIWRDLKNVLNNEQASDYVLSEYYEKKIYISR